MNKKCFVASMFCIGLLNLTGNAQGPRTKVFTRADTLRGSITPERAWWDVMRYDITVAPDYINKTIAGVNILSYKVVKDAKGQMMQVDLQEPMIIDSIIVNNSDRATFTKDGN